MKLMCVFMCVGDKKREEEESTKRNKNLQSLFWFNVFFGLIYEVELFLMYITTKCFA